MDDWSLLQQYVRERSSEALDELMRRHLAMVHATALRQVRDAHLAEDVTQAVFIELIRCAPRMSSRVVLGGWLYQATRFTARKTLRSSWRRQKHEAAAMRAEAREMPLDDESKQKLLNVLDEAMGKLSSTDRDALVLRYLQGKSCREVAEAQRVSEDAARQRLSRALAKLRMKIGGRGIEMSVDVLGAAMVETAKHQPPAELMGRVIGAMRHSSAAVKVGIAARILTMAKTHPIVAAATVMVIGVGLGGVLTHQAWSKAADGAAAAAQLNSPALNPAGTPADTFALALSSASSGDSKTFLMCFHDLTAAQKASLENVAACMGTGTELRKAVAAKFDDAQANGLVMQLGFFPPIPPGVIRTAAPIVNGNTAQLVLPHIPNLTFRKTAEGWKLDPGMIMNSGAVQHFDRLAKSLPELKTVIADINAGKMASLHEVRFKTFGIICRADDTYVEDYPAQPAKLVPSATPKETIAAMMWATRLGKSDAALACFDEPNEQQRAGIERNCKYVAAREEFRGAIAEAFGNIVAHQVTLRLGMEMGLSGSKLATAKETREGNTVTVDLKGSAVDHINLVQKDGVWKVDPKLIVPANPQWVERFDSYYQPAFKQLGEDTKAGKYETPGDLQKQVVKIGAEMKGDYERINTPNGL